MLCMKKIWFYCLTHSNCVFLAFSYCVVPWSMQKCRLASWIAFGYSASVEVKGFKNRASISVMIQCPAPELVQGKQGSIPIKKEPTVCLHLLSSAQWLMKDQKPQRRAVPHSCILFPLNINTPVRQMRLQLPLNFAPEPPPIPIQRYKTVFRTNHLLESKNLFTESLLINGQNQLLIMKYHYLGKQAPKTPIRRFLGATIYIFSGFFLLLIVSPYCDNPNSAIEYVGSAERGQVLQFTITHWYACLLWQCASSFYVTNSL